MDSVTSRNVYIIRRCHWLGGDVIGFLLAVAMRVGDVSVVRYQSQVCRHRWNQRWLSFFHTFPPYV